MIARNEGISQKELGDRLYVEKSTTAKAVKHLLNKGYIHKKQIENDKRYFALYLTEKGIQASVAVQAVFSEILDIFSSNIPEETIEQTIVVLKQVIGNLQEEKRKDISE